MTDWCQCIKNSMDPTTISTWFPLYNLEYLHTEANTKTKLRFEFCITDSKYHILLSQLTKFPRSPFHESSWYPVKRRQHWFKLECVFVCMFHMRTHACHDPRILVDENRRGESFEGATYRTKNSRSHRICHDRAQKNSKRSNARCPPHFCGESRGGTRASRKLWRHTVVEVRFLADRKANTHRSSANRLMIDKVEKEGAGRQLRSRSFRIDHWLLFFFFFFLPRSCFVSIRLWVSAHPFGRRIRQFHFCLS